MTSLWEYREGKRVTVGLEWQEERILSLRITWKDAALSGGRTLYATEAGREFGEALEAYERGEPVRWPALPLAWEQLVPESFRARVLHCLQEQVGHGTLCSYGQLAALVGNPRAARGVGAVMAGNPWPLVVPCHRIVGANGRLTGFSGGQEAIALKAYLLRCEGHEVAGEQRFSRIVGFGTNRF